MSRIAVDISLYPLDADYVPPIKDFIDRLNKQPGLRVESNAMSTQVAGEHDAVFAALAAETKKTFASDSRAFGGNPVVQTALIANRHYGCPTRPVRAKRGGAHSEAFGHDGIDYLRNTLSGEVTGVTYIHLPSASAQSKAKGFAQGLLVVRIW